MILFYTHYVLCFLSLLLFDVGIGIAPQYNFSAIYVLPLPVCREYALCFEIGIIDSWSTLCCDILIVQCLCHLLCVHWIIGSTFYPVFLSTDVSGDLWREAPLHPGQQLCRA